MISDSLKSLTTKCVYIYIYIYIYQVPVATPHKAAAVRPPTTHQENYPS